MRIFLKFLFLFILVGAFWFGWQYSVKDNLGKSLKTAHFSDVLNSRQISAWVENLRKKINNQTVFKVFPVNPCKKTIYYDLGNIDPRYGLSRDKILSLLEKAEQPWEEEGKYNLFEYRPGADFKINFIFDDRQRRTLALKNLDQTLNTLESERDRQIEKFKSRNRKYNELVARYKKKLAHFQAELKKYNKKVEYWRKQGGAPPEEYKKLSKEYKKLQKEKASLEDDVEEINGLARQINKTIRKEKTIVKKYNDQILTYKTKFGVVKRFEQGKYTGKEINIYEFKNDADLLLTLIHEFGHALGLKHVEDPKAIMYYLKDKQDLNNIHLTEADKKALQGLCQLSK